MSSGIGSKAKTITRSLIKNIFDRTRKNVIALPSKAPVQSALKRYQNFTGVEEVRDLHRNVVAAQEKFIAAQERRREAGQNLMNIQRRLKEIHVEMQSISKGDPSYLRLVTEEHKMIVDEESIRKEFEHIEREEREHFGAMTAAVKLSHETEKMYAEKNKYLYVLASLFGTILGVLGSTINNKIKMKEFKELMLEEKNTSRIWNIGVTDAALQKKIGELETRVVAISTNQRTILDYIIKLEKMIETQFHKMKTSIDTTQNYTPFISSNIGDEIQSNSYSLPITIEKKPEAIAFYSFVGAIGLITLFILSKAM